ncbi:LacI family DNA-binding transcriptional regulator [Bifidobacterium vansinderenii]|uniref:LacI family transcriptional regulator n=1 Tax=Bifidobacterium vansinderenii TaxID=1984871 RepID=A0A229W0Y3_9BIFI|nr:LacI family DNA-binding transcriptional regulator [Bifidobacterium vansinderenii]OXN01534.1 LacI family transcriptional regulator [Bifidobacterium vansinderenii]
MSNENRTERAKPGQATIWDVAQAAGVSIATVSRAFSRPGKVSAATLRRVHDAAERLGYRTETIVHHSREDDELRGLISIVVTDLENPISAQYARGVQQYCVEKNYGLMVNDTEEDTSAELAIIKRSLNHVDGVILDSTRMPDTAIRKLARLKPVVVLNRVVSGVTSVTFDCAPSLRRAIEVFARLGHRSISYIAGPDNSWQNGLRRNTILTTCQTMGLTCRLLPCAYPLRDNAAAAFSAFMERPTTAVIAFNDAIAVEFIRFLESHGVGVPQQISVMGIDDIPMGRAITPSLSTISFPRRDMGHAAAKIVIDRLLHIAPGGGVGEADRTDGVDGTGGANDDGGDAVPLHFESSFVQRDSIAAINPLIAAGIG